MTEAVLYLYRNGGIIFMEMLLGFIVLLACLIVGVRHGENLFAAVSGTWCEPLLTPDFFAALAKQADEARQSGLPQKARRFGGMVTFARNLLMMPVVLAHGFRRLLPPY